MAPPPSRFIGLSVSGLRRPVYNSTVLIFGYGSVGRQLGKMLAAMGTTVIAVRRSAPAAGDTSGPIAVHPPSALAALLPTIDTVVIAAPITPETRGVFDTNMLGRLRDGATVVNVGRPEIVDEDAMWAEVAANRIGFAADVWWNESTMSGYVPAGAFFGSRHPFHTRDNVVMTPHFGGGVGLAGIEDERAEAVFSTVTEALAGRRQPCDLELGY